jgi:DNA polymerase
MQKIWLDFETASCLSLDERGLDNYARDSSTRVLMASYAFDDKAPNLWQPRLNPEIPADLEDALRDPLVQCWSWNATFEKTISQCVLGINKPIEEFRDPMCMARALSLPGDLEEAGRLLGLTQASAKIADGKRLIKLFCEPEDEGGYETLFGLAEPTFCDWRTHPQDWTLFCEYCKQDVIAERAAAHKMRKFPLPNREWETWFLSEKVNSTGWPVDAATVNGARGIVYKELEPLTQKLKELTGLQNPNSRNQMLAWLQTQGYGFSSLNKDFVVRALVEGGLTDLAKEVIEIRTQTSKSSVSKYTALADMTGADGRVRHQYTYYGAHTGRWAAHGVNMGNLFKPTKAVEARLELAVDLVRKMDYEGIVREFGKPLEVAASVQRSAFRAPEGYEFVVADLNAIENRGLGYLARCNAILNVFREGKDPYLDFAVRMFKMPYEKLLAEYEAGDKYKRTICKPPVLGAGYGLGPGKHPDKQLYDEMNNPIYEGLQGYARKMGVEMNYDEAKHAVDVFRNSYPEVKWLWKDMERAAVFAIRNPGQIVGVGVPQSDRDREYFERIGRKIYEPILSFKCNGTKVLEMMLPSGRSLHYIDPRVRREKRVWQDQEYENDVIYYMAKDQQTKVWQETKTFGGHLVENADQAVSRDILVHGMKLADARGFQIVGHTYDEIVTLVPVNSGLGLKELCECMTDEPAWCKGNFPLGADGFESDIYRK